MDVGNANLIGSDPKTAPLQLRAAIALSAYKTECSFQSTAHNYQILSHETLIEKESVKVNVTKKIHKNEKKKMTNTNTSPKQNTILVNIHVNSRENEQGEDETRHQFFSMNSSYMVETPPNQTTSQTYKTQPF